MVPNNFTTSFCLRRLTNSRSAALTVSFFVRWPPTFNASFSN